MNKASSAKPHPSCEKKCPYWSDPDPRTHVAQKMLPPIGEARALRIDKKTRGTLVFTRHRREFFLRDLAPVAGTGPPARAGSGLAKAGAKGAKAR